MYILQGNEEAQYGEKERSSQGANGEVESNGIITRAISTVCAVAISAVAVAVAIAISRTAIASRANGAGLGWRGCCGRGSRFEANERN